MENISSALTVAGKLSPQIRLAQAISEFGSLFTDDEARHAQFKNLRSRSPPTAGEVVQLTEEINRDGSRRHRSWKPFATRLVLVLERIQQFAPVGDVLTGGAQNMLASGIWASVRMALEISLGFLSYFDKVSTLLLRIGRCVSLHQDFAILFPQCRQIQACMCEYTIVIVQVCKEIVVYARKSFATQLASSFLSPFDSVFKPLEDQLLQWGRLIEKRTQIMAVKSTLQQESASLERYNRLQLIFSRHATDARAVGTESRKHRFLKALSPDQKEFDSIWRRERRRGTSQWILQNPRYQEWLSSPQSAILWLQGNLGSGKSVTMASIVASLMTSEDALNGNGTSENHSKVPRTLSYFFCTKSADKTLKLDSILGSLACQVLRHETMGTSLLRFLGTKGNAVESLISTDYIDLLLAITPQNWQGVLVLDGLDEAPLKEVEELFVHLLPLMQQRHVLICCSSRSNSHCKSVVESKVTITSNISMETEDRSADFQAYISAEIERWKTIRPIPSEVEQLIIKQLVVGCQGMFLWLSLQMEAICSRHTQELRSDSGILNILHNLPRDLPEAFDQALLRISDLRYGCRALQLVAVADPPLSSDELRVAVNVEPGSLAWNPATVLGSGHALISHCGGSLLEIDEEDLCVRFIHHSVLIHLVQPAALPAAAPFHFEVSDAEVALAAICVTYLNYSIFEDPLIKAEKIPLTNIPNMVQKSVLSPNAITRKVWSLLSRTGRKVDSHNIDLQRLLLELQTYDSKATDEVHLLLAYMSKCWLDLTRCLPNSMEPAICALWSRLVDGNAGSTLKELPWTPGSPASATAWAIYNEHKALLRHQVCNPDAAIREEAANTTISILRERSGGSRLTVGNVVWSHDPPICLPGSDLGYLAPTYLLSAYARRDLFVTDVAILADIKCRSLGLEDSFDYFEDPSRAASSLDVIAREMIPKVLHNCTRPCGIFESCSDLLRRYLREYDAVLDNGLTYRELFNRCAGIEEQSEDEPEWAKKYPPELTG